MKKLLVATLLATSTIGVFAQSGTNSPYSQYGLGVLSEPTGGYNRGMNGVGVAFRENSHVNTLNPASYSAIDSLTFIFDVGLSGQLTNFKEGGKRINAQNANFEYAVAGFRAFKHLGVSFGLIPFTNVGYSYSNTYFIDDTHSTTFTGTYQGSGGIHQVYLGLGWELFKGFSLGGNIAYVWGDYKRSVVNAFQDTYANTLTKYYTAEISNYKADFGFQYAAKVNKHNIVAIGATYSPAKKIGGTPTYQLISTNSQTNLSDTLTLKANGQLELPAMISAGLMWKNDDRIKVGVDYQLQQWKNVNFPQYQAGAQNGSYLLTSGLFNDRHKITIGGMYTPNPMGRNVFQRTQYKLGVSYATPYLRINEKDGPNEMSVSAGMSIPIRSSYSSRSLLNISAQWVRQHAQTFISENTFRINIGITFNERWFEKWKVQ